MGTAVHGAGHGPRRPHSECLLVCVAPVEGSPGGHGWLFKGHPSLGLSDGRGSGWGPARNSWRASRLGGVREWFPQRGSHSRGRGSSPPTSVVKSSMTRELVPRVSSRLPVGPEVEGASLQRPWPRPRAGKRRRIRPARAQEMAGHGKTGAPQSGPHTLQGGLDGRSQQ